MQPRPQTSISFWTGAKFKVNPDGDCHLSVASDNRLQVLAIGGHTLPAGSAPMIGSVTAHFAVQSATGVIDAPFYAAVADAGSGRTSKFGMPVAPRNGLLFSVDSQLARRGYGMVPSDGGLNCLRS